MNFKKLTRKKYTRNDGWLAELISSAHDDVPFTGIHSYLVLIKPNSYRAMHYHNKKEEWIGLTAGKLMIVLEDILTKERTKIVLDKESKEYSLIYIPSKVAHVIKNIGDVDASLVVFSKTMETPGDTVDYKMEL
jgi:dTDP-4-dehydrorhamnose 3,5-epimerase-like enzyme